LTAAEYAEANHFGHIITAKSGRPHWRNYFSDSFTEKLIRAAGDASVHVVARAKDPQAQNAAGSDSKAAKPRRTELKAYIVSLAYVAAAILVAALLRHVLGVSNLTQVFLIAILASAVTYGLWASLFACLVSVLSGLLQSRCKL
jgi:two-component system sensor histidine kinase KdpD